MRWYSQDIRIESGTKKGAMLIMRSGKPHITEGIKLPNQTKNHRTKGNLQIFGNIRSGHHQTWVDGRKFFLKRVSQENEKATRNQII